MKEYPALILNADYQPISYFPLSLWSWQDSIKAVFLERVNIIAEYESEVRSSTFSMKIPSVIALKKYIPISKKPPFTRFNLFLRDDFSCQYCGDIFTSNDLTFDHVIPKSKGGKNDWKNLATCCKPCNLKKDNKSINEVGFKLKHQPYKPTYIQFVKNVNINNKTDWLPYLFS